MCGLAPFDSKLNPMNNFIFIYLDPANHSLRVQERPQKPQVRFYTRVVSCLLGDILYLSPVAMQTQMESESCLRLKFTELFISLEFLCQPFTGSLNLCMQTLILPHTQAVYDIVVMYT